METADLGIFGSFASDFLSRTGAALTDKVVRDIDPESVIEQSVDMQAGQPASYGGISGLNWYLVGGVGVAFLATILILK